MPLEEHESAAITKATLRWANKRFDALRDRCQKLKTDPPSPYPLTFQASLPPF
jgi:hypothetical protein